MSVIHKLKILIIENIGKKGNVNKRKEKDIEKKRKEPLTAKSW